MNADWTCRMRVAFRHHFSAEYEQANDALCVLTLEYLQRVKLKPDPFVLFLCIY